MTYTARTFDLPELKGLSKKQIEVHLALYEGYVKHVNLITETLKSYAGYGDKASEGDKLAIAELRRRLGFEFDGMRMHEYYFEQFEGGSKEADPAASLAACAKEKYGNRDGYIKHIKDVAGTRGIGWVVTYYDPVGKTLHTSFVNDHEIGQLAGLPIILAVDLWEHAYMVDYVPKEKMTYVDAFLSNVNWSTVEARLAKAL
ncbi:MAG: superoxide dismutase, Fe-Mn family [Parcubacteria bacterium C7867-001]|nr:MAG: superoxide dismutase, Fe-Mn family [Parcubacteria bacterium C7867-001]